MIESLYHNKWIFPGPGGGRPVIPATEEAEAGGYKLQG